MAFRALCTLFALGHVSFVFAYSSPPSGAITVGHGGTYSTISAALKDTSSSVYFVYAGSYTEQVYITRANVKIYGQTNYSHTYTGNQVMITHAENSTTAGGDDPSGTVRVHATNVALYNLNIANTFGNAQAHSQAIALSVQGSQFGGYGLRLTGYQDTLYADSGSQIYAYSYISGAVDYIFGQTSSVWITNSELVSVGSGAITASGRSSNDANWYVINNSTVSGTGTSFLGRPWRDYARVVFQYCSLGSEIAPAGWEQWSSSTPNTDHVYYGEYANTGPGATGTRASFATKLAAPVPMASVLGSANPSWVDASFL